MSLLNCVPYVLTCRRALCVYVLTCQRVLPAYVLTCSRANVPCVLTCSRSHVPYVLTCSNANVPCMLCVPTCSHVITTTEQLTKISFQQHVFLTFLWLFFAFFQWNKTVVHSCISLTSQKPLTGAMKTLYNEMVK